MALKFKANIDHESSNRIIKKLKRLKRPVSVNDAKLIGSTIAEEMKNQISKGISPIAGKGRFEGYRGGYKDRIKEYKNVRVNRRGYPKKLRPINLKLTGKFLKGLKHWTRGGFLGGFAAIVGFKTSDKLSVKKERGHREGANDQAERPIIPKGKEFFSRRIQNKVIKILNAVIKRETKKKG